LLLFLEKSCFQISRKNGSLNQNAEKIGEIQETEMTDNVSIEFSSLVMSDPNIGADIQ
jgi:hypothetical protein